VFNSVDGRFKFVLFYTEKGQQTTEFKCAFMQHDPAKLPAIEDYNGPQNLDHLLSYKTDGRW